MITTMTSSDERMFVSPTHKERGYLVGVDLRGHRYQNHPLAIEDSLEELQALCETAGIKVLGSTFQKLNKPHPASLIGSGKVSELKTLKESLALDTMVFDDELSPRQQRVLEKELDIKVLDRTALILDIFARHARTHEGQLQVELAQLEYRLPRLTRMWTHLARQAGGRAGGVSGGVGVRGPGETQLEVDRREINRKIAYLKEALEGVRAHRARHRNRRRQTRIPVIAIVGYTNAGKSTLLNALLTKTNTDPEAQRPIYAADQLFATLDPTTRRIKVPSGREFLFSDTVGFIQKLPTQLVAAFRATLEEVIEADLLLHVVDATHPNAIEQAEVVQQTLAQLEADHIPALTALNKVDAFDTNLNGALPENAVEIGSTLEAQQALFPDAVPISAHTGYGLNDLLARIEETLESNLIPVALHLPYADSRLVSLLHAEAIVESEAHDETGTQLEAKIPRRLLSTFADYQI